MKLKNEQNDEVVEDKTKIPSTENISKKVKEKNENEKLEENFRKVKEKIEIEEKLELKKQEVKEILNSGKVKIKGYWKNTQKEQEPEVLAPIKTSFWRVLAYFIIYSFLGFVIETLFALVNYGVFESRQSFLYGPFCSIYGLGAVIIILVLRYKFFKNNYTLFVGGFFVGSIVEYFVSLFGELLLNVKWWDYSDRFLNINGRICFLYSVFWGILGVYLLKSVNPQIDKFIDWILKKINVVFCKSVTGGLIIFLFIDCLLSAYAINVFLVRVCVEENLPVEHKVQVEELYHEIYDNKEKSEFIYKYFSNEKMILTYPNLTITLEDGTLKRVAEYYPNIRNCYYRFNVNRNM